MYKLYKEAKQDDLHLVGIRLRDITIWQIRNRQRQMKMTYDWDQIDRIAFDKKSFSIVLKRQTNESKIKYLTNNSKKYRIEKFSFSLKFVEFSSRGKYLFELSYDMYKYTKALLLRHNSRYSLLNEPIGEREFEKNSFLFKTKRFDFDFSGIHAKWFRRR
jgi:hypothetical protein